MVIDVWSRNMKDLFIIIDSLLLAIFLIMGIWIVLSKSVREGMAINVIKRHLKRFFVVLFKKEYKTLDEKIKDSQYLTRINIVIIALWLIYLAFAFNTLFRCGLKLV